ncbi:eL32 family ribosomal protein [uncultured Methanobrevibacter sp.]|uniref:eL32 family ribosomal protein n=1 Tax=uncultured Methanobrevibacter sp. TaxID=253161 RepID=UPI0025FC9F47|nr:eL32 family ribosomal protein [uncultured Methanobrevibacter sp.]
MANKRFKRQEYARYKKLGIKWRRPRGKTSKMRRYEAKELEDLDPASDAARISASIGKRKKDLMLEKASELGIKVLNK